MVAIEINVTLATERVINISQYKDAAVSYLIVSISAILKPTKLKFGMKMPLHPTVSSVRVARETLVTIATRQVIDISVILRLRNTNFGLKILIG